EGDVQQRLVQLAFGEFGPGPPGIHRLTDPVQLPGAVVRPHEFPPGGDDPRGVAADLGHVGEPDPAGPGAEVPAQQLYLLAAHYDQRRGALGDRAAQERPGRGAEFRRAGVQQGLVPVAACGWLHRGAIHAHLRTPSTCAPSAAPWAVAVSRSVSAPVTHSAVEVAGYQYCVSRRRSTVTRAGAGKSQ